MRSLTKTLCFIVQGCVEARHGAGATATVPLSSEASSARGVAESEPVGAAMHSRLRVVNADREVETSVSWRLRSRRALALAVTNSLAS